MDLDKQEIDDELALVLELPESDPLFMRKKVEIYFNGDNTREYSNNEWQALNNLLEATAKSLSGDKHKMKNVMQTLRDEVVDRIHKVGSKYGVESKFVGCSNWDKEKCLLDWSVC